jgi:hypothetical protein
MVRHKSAAPHERSAIVAHVKRSLPEWYRGLDVDPPDTSEPEWLRMVSFDLTPDEDFKEIVEGTRGYCERTKKPFPKQMTRRGLLRLHLKLAQESGKGTEADMEKGILRGGPHWLGEP